MAVTMSDADLLARMKNYEDHFVERKTSGDAKDILKTIIGFANSAPLDLPAILYIGVRDSGEIETPQVNLDSLQKTVNKELRRAYPPIACFQKIVEDTGRQALAVIVFGSENRPHFAGPSYVRSGSETFEASDEQFNELIARRNSKVTRILEYKGKPISAMNRQKFPNGFQESNWTGNLSIYYCDQFFVTISNGAAIGNRTSFPLSEVEISFDDKENRLLLKIHR